MNPERLEQMLQAVGAEIDYPETPDLAGGVIRRLELEPRSSLPRARLRPRWLRPALAAAALVVALAFTLVFSPTVREAAADLLGIVGIHISVGDDGPPAPVASTGPLDLGTRLSVSAAAERVDFPVKLPAVVAGTPAAYFDASVGTEGLVSLVYPEDASDHSDVDVLIGQFRASIDEGFFKKVSQTGGEVRFVTVGTGTGFWVHGEPHVFYYVDADGAFREETLRLADDTLLWESGGIAYRIEGAGTLDRALAIANNLR